MLTLPIKQQWYSLILQGIKKEEYRDIKPYYTSRFSNALIGIGGENTEDYIRDNLEKYRRFKVRFRNGYSKNSPSFIATVSLSIGEGNPEWGAELNKKYYVLKILKIEEEKDNDKLTKEECTRALEQLSVNVNPATDDNVFTIIRLINGYFELVEKYDELERTSYSLECELNDICNPQPYKFEDLKPNKWVWDDKYKTCYVIKKVKGKGIFAKYCRWVINPFTDECEESDSGWMGNFGPAAALRPTHRR